MALIEKSQIWGVIESCIRAARVLLLHGVPGTGKSHAAHSASLDGRELFTVTLTQDTPAVELRGHLWPVASKDRKATEFVWKDGPAIAAWRNGGRLVINEIDHAGGDCLSFLMNILDTEATAAITLPTGETLRPHPRFQCIATMNGNPDLDLSEALRSRFDCNIEVVDPHPNGIAALPEDLREAARHTVACENADRRITLRAWLAFAKYREELGAEHAAFAVFGNRAEDVLNSLRVAS
jgi:MoxR-like ATPase